MGQRAWCKGQRAESREHGGEGLEHGAWRIEHRVAGDYLRDFWKLVICRHSMSSLSKSLFINSSGRSLLIERRISMLAFSKVDLLAIFKNCMNSFFEDEPDPSAILLDIDIPAPRSCSAKRYNFLCSRSSAISNSSLAISIANCQIFKS